MTLGHSRWNDFDPAKDLIIFKSREDYDERREEAYSSNADGAAFSLNQQKDGQFLLLSLRHIYEAETQNNGRHLLEAIGISASHGWPLAPWVADAVLAHQDRVTKMEVRTWNELLGPLWRKGMRLPEAKKATMVAFDIYRNVRALHVGEKRPIDEGLFEEVGRNYGFKARRTADLYYEVKNALEAHGLKH